MSKLQGLDLSNNQIRGDLPASWGTLATLQVGCRAQLLRAGWCRLG